MSSLNENENPAVSKFNPLFKMKLSNEIGIQSWCFRAFKDNRDVIRRLKECDVARIELCGAHADFFRPSGFEDVIRMYRDAGIGIVSIGVQGIKGDEKNEAPFYQFARESGARFMSVDFAVESIPASFRSAEKLAAEYDIHLAIHNHGGRHWLGCARMLQHVFNTTNDRIGLCLDTAWALDSGEDPLAMVEKFRGRLYGLHFKDFEFDRARCPKDVVLGEGNLKVAEMVDALKKTKFEGYAVIEYEADENNPVPALSKCVKILKTMAG
ncbi:MAG: TIM barrel protein [Verrucomicrobiae bacterium]|nr:TIM barrel protein [Verrucomicrobiae bacterium]